MQRSRSRGKPRVLSQTTRVAKCRTVSSTWRARGTALLASKYLNKLQRQHHKCENENENGQPNKIALDLEIGRRLLFGFCRKQPEKPCELGKRHGCRIVSRTTLPRVPPCLQSLPRFPDRPQGYST